MHKRTERSDEILAAATLVFSEHGYAASSIQEIADRVGLLKGSLYHHVDSKKQLLLNVMVHVHEGLMSAIDGALEEVAGHDSLTRLRAIIREHLSFMVENAAGIGVFLNDFRSLDGPERAAIVSLRSRYEQLVDSILQEGQTEGLIRQDLECRTMAMALFGMLNWSHQWFRPGSEAEVAELADDFSAILLQGITAPNA